MDVSLPPVEDKISGETRLSTQPWKEWFNDLTRQFMRTPSRVGVMALIAGQTASIGATNVSSLGLVGAGSYRVTHYLRVTTAAGTSSSIQFTLSWVEGGVTLTHNFAALTGNTTTTQQSGSLMVRIGGSGTLTYATTYASNPGAAMVYRLDVYLERMPRG